MRKVNVYMGLLLMGLGSCTNISFRQYYNGPKGLDFSTGICLVKEINAPISAESNGKLTVVLLEYVNEICGDSFVYLGSFNSDSIETVQNDSSASYILSVEAIVSIPESSGLALGSWDTFNEVSVQIKVFETRTGRRVYYQKIIASEFKPEANETGLTFTRSSDNVIKNAMVRGLKDLRKHSRKLHGQNSFIP